MISEEQNYLHGTLWLLAFFTEHCVTWQSMRVQSKSTEFLGVGAEMLPRGPGKESPGCRGNRNIPGPQAQWIELEPTQVRGMTEHHMPKG